MQKETAWNLSVWETETEDPLRSWLIAGAELVNSMSTEREASTCKVLHKQARRQVSAWYTHKNPTQIHTCTPPTHIHMYTHYTGVQEDMYKVLVLMPISAVRKIHSVSVLIFYKAMNRSLCVCMYVCTHARACVCV